jgi:hypothetical protein
MGDNRNTTRGLRFRNISSGEKSKKNKESIKVKKAGRIEVGEDTTISSNDIW